MKLPFRLLPMVVCALALRSANGAIIVESAQLGLRTDSGAWIGVEQFVGTRFHLDNLTQIQQIGGAIPNSSGSIFGAIFALSGPAAFPLGNPFDAAPLAVTVFDPGYPWPNWDIRVPLDVTLAAGDYALLFGSGLYGATGHAVATTDNIDVPGSSCLWWDNWYAPSAAWVNWNPTANGAVRFVVEGVAVPEPACSTLLALGTALLVRQFKRK